MRRVKKACVSSSAIPSWWSTQPSRVTLMPKVKSPTVSSAAFGNAIEPGWRADHLFLLGVTATRSHANQNEWCNHHHPYHLAGCAKSTASLPLGNAAGRLIG